MRPEFFRLPVFDGHKQTTCRRHANEPQLDSTRCPSMRHDRKFNNLPKELAKRLSHFQIHSIVGEYERVIRAADEFPNRPNPGGRDYE